MNDALETMGGVFGGQVNTENFAGNNARKNSDQAGGNKGLIYSAEHRKSENNIDPVKKILGMNMM